MNQEDPIPFFDRLSDGYGERYSGKDRFHRYFFHERAEKAIAGLLLADCDVLDIGSGTGDLYTILKPRFPGLRFTATDVSTGMLAHSPVPAERRLLGHAYDLHFGELRFTAIFMLGVTTYMSREELEKNLAFAARHLAPHGTLVITFTNKYALDTWSRALAKWPMALFGKGNHVLSSGLRIHRYGHREIRTLIERQFKIDRWNTLNHTIFPLNRLLVRPSLLLAQYLSRHRGAPEWIRPLSSDIMVHATSRESNPAQSARQGNP